MFYEFGITVPADTKEATPELQDLQLTHGIIHRIDVQFPIGCAGMVKCRLEHHSFGHLPMNPEGYYSSDGFIITQEDNLEFFAEPFIIRAVCWSPDTVYQHIVTVRVGIIESKFALALISVVTGLQKFLKMVGIKT